MAKIRLEVFPEGGAWRYRAKNRMGVVGYPGTWESRASALAAAVRHAQDGWRDRQESFDIYYESDGAFILHPHAFGHIA